MATESSKMSIETAWVIEQNIDHNIDHNMFDIQKSPLNIFIRILWKQLLYRFDSTAVQLPNVTYFR
jgi:hypothetical protein